MTRILCWLATFGLVFQAMAAVTPGGGGGGGGGPTNGITSAQATNIVAAMITNKVDKSLGFATNLWATNVAFHGTVGATNVTVKFHEPQTNQNIVTWYSFGDAAGGTRNWQQVVGTNRWYFQNGTGASAIPFQLHGNGLGNVTLGHNTSSTTTNAGDLRVLGTAYDANGNAYSTNGGGGSQTPWTSDINGDGYSLTNMGTIRGGGYLQMDYAYLLPDSNEVGLAISPLTGAGNAVEVKDTNSNAALYVSPDGKVGVKTNAPGRALDVAGTIVVGLGNVTQPGYSFNSLSNYGMFAGTGPNRVNFAVAGFDMMSIRSDNSMVEVRNGGGFAWSSTADSTGTPDTIIYRHGPNTNGFGNSVPTATTIASNAVLTGLLHFRTNTVNTPPSAAQIGQGGFIIWSSNGSPWMSRCVDGSTVESKSFF